MGNPIILAGIATLIVLLVVGLIWYFKSASRAHVSDRWTSGRKAGEKKQEKPAAQRKKRKPQRSRASGESLPARLVKPLSRLLKPGGSSASRVQEMLVHAGIREKGAVEIFLGAKIAIAIFMLVVPVAIYYVWLESEGGFVGEDHGGTLVMIACGGLGLGLLMPTWWLRGKAKKRIEAIRLSLPDALDLMIVCIEAGLGLDAALVRISDELGETAPEICEDLTLLNLEISAGKPREECLRNLALRTGCEEVESLAARINQATKYGTNLGHSLRIHSESLRQKRRQEAEERAAKTTVKLLFPLVFFIFPAIFVVILGPGVIKLVEQFS